MVFRRAIVKNIEKIVLSKNTKASSKIPLKILEDAIVFLDRTIYPTNYKQKAKEKPQQKFGKI